jgi:hypothetical protein
LSQEFARRDGARDLMSDIAGSRRFNGVRNIRQALASPHPAVVSRTGAIRIVPDTDGRGNAPGAFTGIVIVARRPEKSGAIR